MRFNFNNVWEDCDKIVKYHEEVLINFNLWKRYSEEVVVLLNNPLTSGDTTVVALT